MSAPRTPRWTALALAATALGALLTGVPPVAAQEGDEQPTYQLVIHASNPAASLPRNTVAKMFLKQIKSWPDSDLAVVPIDQLEDAAVRLAFTRAVHQKRIANISKYWQRQIFSGREVLPPRATSDEEVLTFVRANPGAIGYVSSDADLGDDVKPFSIAAKGDNDSDKKNRP